MALCARCCPLNPIIYLTFTKRNHMTVVLQCTHSLYHISNYSISFILTCTSCLIYYQKHDNLNSNINCIVHLQYWIVYGEYIHCTILNGTGECHHKMYPLRTMLTDIRQLAFYNVSDSVSYWQKYNECRLKTYFMPPLWKDDMICFVINKYLLGK